MVAWGYIDGAYPLSFGGSATGYVGADGEIAFREGTFLDYGAALSADTIYIVSSSSSDTSTFTIQGLDATGAYQTAQVTATGTTPAAVSGTWNHVQRIISDGAVNVGTVYVSTDSGAIPTTTGDQIQVVMVAGENYAINPLLICPTDQVFTINAFDFSVDVNQSSTIRIYANRQGREIINFKFYAGAAQDQFHQTFHTPLRLFAGDSLKVTVQAAGGTASSATFGMNGVVLDVTDLQPNRSGIGTVIR
jgi:VCBS repeat-containing protein